MKVVTRIFVLAFALLGTAFLGTAFPASGPGKAQFDFEEALLLEEALGKLEEAIALYQRVIADAETEALAAQAQLHIGMCYEKLGKQEAKKAYQAVIDRYPSQQKLVHLARQRLEALGPPLGGTDPAVRVKADRVVWAGENVEHVGGSVSLDGHFISYTDWYFTGNLMLHDLASGTDRPLTGNKDWRGGGNAGGSTFSRDGKQVAYSWQNWEPRFWEIRIVNLEGTGVPQPRRVFANEDLAAGKGISPSDWSSDGKWLAVHLVRKDRNGQIGLVGVQDGSLRVLKSVGWRGPNKIFFSPDSKYMAYDLPASDAVSQRDVFVIAVDGSREAPAVVHPAHDVVMGWSPDGSQLLFASDRTGSVGLWALPMADGKPRAAPTLLKPDIGSVSSLGLTASGALHIFKDTSTQALHVAPIDLDAGKLLGGPVVQSYRSARPDWSRDGKYLAYRSTGSNGINFLSIRSVESGQVRELRTALHYFNEPRWSPDARWLVTGGRDFKGRSGIYRIDAETGAVSFITPSGPATRVEVSPDGKKIYYPDPVKRDRYIERDLASEETRGVFRTPAQSERGRVELSPDGRYAVTIIMEAAAETSTVLLIPIAGGELRELLRVSLPESFAPGGRMSWTPNSRAVIVTKEIGAQTLFSDAHVDRKELWLVPIGDGEARKLHIDVDDWNGGIRLHPNGQQIAFFAGKQSQEVWALENFLPARKASE
ncbi:tetratricopeptide repeat protein [Acidobacteria bacterium AH-259-O06]|nr:tetratricopeptide repeat protein [Acidobacteria bacterium AH-259-O06]